MKTIAFLVLASAAAAGIWLHRTPPGAEGKTTSPPRARIRPAERPPFWESARIPDDPPPPAGEIVLERTRRDTDFPEEVRRLAEAGDLPTLNFTLAAWFEEHPEDVRQWLSARDSLEPYQTALSMIATRVSGNGDPENALAWAGLLQPGPERDRLIFDIFALAARENRLPVSRLGSAPLPDEQIEQLLNGAPGD